MTASRSQVEPKVEAFQYRSVSAAASDDGNLFKPSGDVMNMGYAAQTRGTAGPAAQPGGGTFDAAYNVLLGHAAGGGVTPDAQVHKNQPLQAMTANPQFHGRPERQHHPTMETSIDNLHFERQLGMAAQSGGGTFEAASNRTRGMPLDGMAAQPGGGTFEAAYTGQGDGYTPEHDANESMMDYNQSLNTKFTTDPEDAAGAGGDAPHKWHTPPPVPTAKGNDADGYGGDYPHTSVVSPPPAPADYMQSPVAASAGVGTFEAAHNSLSPSRSATMVGANSPDRTWNSGSSHTVDPASMSHGHGRSSFGEQIQQYSGDEHGFAESRGSTLNTNFTSNASSSGDSGIDRADRSPTKPVLKPRTSSQSPDQRARTMGSSASMRSPPNDGFIFKRGAGETSQSARTARPRSLTESLGSSASSGSTRRAPSRPLGASVSTRRAPPSKPRSQSTRGPPMRPHNAGGTRAPRPVSMLDPRQAARVDVRAQSSTLGGANALQFDRESINRFNGGGGLDFNPSVADNQPLYGNASKQLSITGEYPDDNMSVVDDAVAPLPYSEA